jgi:hypothetical protein
MRRSRKTADYWILFFALAAGALYLPGASGKSSPRIGTAVCQDAKIGVAHLGPGLSASVRYGRRDGEQQGENAQRAQLGHKALS